MRNRRAAAIVIGLLIIVPAHGLAQPGVAQPKGGTGSPMSKAQGAVHATRGVVAFVDANTLVITRSRRHGHEMTFLLEPSTERVGDVAVGATVDIRYRSGAKQQVATAVTVVQAKQWQHAGEVGR